MGKLSVTRKFEFSYAHFLPDYNGPCGNLHGHNSHVEVEAMLVGDLPRSGMIIDFKDLDKLVWEYALNHLDHSQINKLFEARGSRTAPTAENICLFIFEQVKNIEKLHKHLRIVRVRVSETADSFAEIKED